MSISKITEEYVLEHPSVKDCLKNDLVNFSSLSRRIVSELKLKRKDFDAVLIACRRLQRKLKSEGASEKEIINILKKSKIEIKNKMAAAVLERDIYFENLISIEKNAKKQKETFRIIEGASAITVITSEDFLGSVEKSFRNKIIMVNENLAEITIRSPKEIETTPGAYAYLCSLFREKNINIVETLSCWTDTIFLVDEKDVGKAIRLLRF